MSKINSRNRGGGERLKLELTMRRLRNNYGVIWRAIGSGAINNGWTLWGDAENKITTPEKNVSYPGISICISTRWRWKRTKIKKITKRDLLSVRLRSRQVADGGQGERGPVEGPQILAGQGGVVSRSVGVNPIALKNKRVEILEEHRRSPSPRHSPGSPPPRTTKNKNTRTSGPVSKECESDLSPSTDSATPSWTLPYNNN